MINLYFEESFWGNGLNGPYKVVNNLIKSLHQENIQFSVNLEKYKHNFIIQYDEIGHIKHSQIEQETCIIGPQVWLFEERGKFLIDNPQYYKTIIAPSQWVKDKYIDLFSLPEKKVSVWPVGIELKEYKKNIKYDCLIYFKRRNDSELKLAIDFLKSKNLSYKVLSYGSYGSSDLEKYSNQCKFCFLINGTESQGIAVQEIMAMNTPLFVWDVNFWDDMGEKYRVPATSIPYWSDECGKVFYDFSNIEIVFEEFYANIEEYIPRNYVERELSFETSISKLLEIMN